jgi:Inner membrane component of T3SS, cytoplasmic domain
VATTRLEGRAFFEHQQQRRREAQARLTGRPLQSRLSPPPVVSPSAVTQTNPFVPAVPLPRILATSGALAGRAFDLHPGELIIGRGAGSEIRLDDPAVSHNHAVLRVDGYRVTIEDLRSTNGTRVNGAIIERQTPLAPGDQIDVGGVQLRLETR